MTIDLFTRPGVMVSTLSRRSSQGLKSWEDARERHGWSRALPKNILRQSGLTIRPRTYGL